MNNFPVYIIACAIVVVLTGCTGLTRTEVDNYSIINRDTTTAVVVKNAPGNRDNDSINTMSKIIKSEKILLQKDSVAERHYPNFIRFGAFESIGLFGSVSGHSTGSGIFGIFPDFKNSANWINKPGNTNFMFSGNIYRFGIAEWQLHWFREAKNWTFGTSLAELYSLDIDQKSMLSFFPLNVRKRYYLHETIPYVSFTTTLGIGWFPSQYINLSTSLDVGSIGGLNLRTYLGVTAGTTTKNNFIGQNGSNPNQTRTTVFPYFGLGMSFLDFINLPAETQREWKDYEHSAWDIGLLQIGLISAPGATSLFAKSDSTGSIKQSLFTGFILRVASTSLALPLPIQGTDNKFYAGTSLINLIALGKHEGGIGILPIRLGFWQTLMDGAISTEPFVELNYFPSTMFHIGNRLNLRLGDMINISFLLGYVTGNNGNLMGTDLGNQFNINSGFSKFYFGFSLGIADKIFFPENLRYNK